MVARIIELMLMFSVPAVPTASPAWFGDRAVPPDRPLPGAPLPPGLRGNRPAPRGLNGLQAIAPPLSSGAAVIELMEDDAGRMARALNVGEDLTSLGKAGAWGEDCFSGVCCMKVAGFQRFRSNLPGWGYPVVEKPKPGEYRYLRFAWKKPEGAGIMVQLCAGGLDWGRYFAGQNTAGFYPAQQIAAQPPREWQVVTRDLFTDFGTIPFNLTGFAFASLDGAALFDHIYLGRTIEELDRVTDAARAASRSNASPGTTQLEEQWKKLASEDAVVRKPAEWALGAGGSASATFIASKVKVPDAAESERKIRLAIADLDSPRFAVREKANKELESFSLTALPHLEAALKPEVSPEWRERLEKLIAKCKAEDILLNSQQQMTLRAIHVLELTETPEAKKLLASLAAANLEAGLSLEANAAIERMEKRRK